MAAAFPGVVSKVESDEEFDMRDDAENINTAIDLKDTYENMESDLENEQDSDSKSHSNDSSDDLRIQVKAMARKSNLSWKGICGEVAKAKAFNVLLPFSEGRCENCSINIKWFRRLKCDPVHEEVMKTPCRFLDEDS